MPKEYQGVESMRIKYECLPCLVNQVIKVADMTKTKDKDALFHKVFSYLSTLDFNMTNPEVIGVTFDILKKQINVEDPYRGIRQFYNKLFLDIQDEFEKKINQGMNPLEEAVKYAILGNIIDFNPIHNNSLDDIMTFFNERENLKFEINDMTQMLDQLSEAKTLLYLGDNCGEICLDKILIKKLKERYPNLTVYFGVRGVPVVNDSILEDAYMVGMDEYATIISNGDKSLGTVLKHTSQEFQRTFSEADIVIAKGQANYESLSETEKDHMYFLLMTKCAVIASDLGVSVSSLICKKAR